MTSSVVRRLNPACLLGACADKEKGEKDKKACLYLVITEICSSWPGCIPAEAFAPKLNVTPGWRG